LAIALPLAVLVPRVGRSKPINRCSPFRSTVMSISRLQLGWWCGVAVTRCVWSTKLLYAGPGYYLDGWLSASR